MDRSWTKVRGVVIPGHGVASGQTKDPRYPEGTLVLQRPHFEEAGVDLKTFHLATINISIKPKRWEPRRAAHTIRGVAWTDHIPPEDFSFFHCRLGAFDRAAVDGLVYYPHPETKPEHFQDPSTIEVLVPFIEGIEYGTEVMLEVDSEEIGVL